MGFTKSDLVRYVSKNGIIYHGEVLSVGECECTVKLTYIGEVYLKGDSFLCVCLNSELCKVDFLPAEGCEISYD